MGWIKKAFNFVISPSHSRTMALVGMLVLVSAVFLTVSQNQQQQTTKQHAAETRGYAPCNKGLTCGDTTVGADCGSGEYKCYSQDTLFYTSDKINDKYLACCRGTGYGLVNGTCTLVKGDVETVACTPPPPVTSGDYSQCAEHLDDCGPATVGADCGSGKIKCIARTGYTDSSADSIDRHPLVCCTQPIVPVPAATNTDTCTLNGGNCIPMGPCVPPATQNTSYSCGNNTNGSVCCTIPTTPICVRSGGFYSGPSGNFECCSGLTKCASTGTCQPNCDTSNPAAPAADTSKTNNTNNTSTTNTTTPNLFTCVNQTGDFAGNYQCKTIINGTTQCDSGFAAYSPSAPYTGFSCGTNQGCCKQGTINQANLFTCQNQTGTYAGNYACADIINGTTQCSSGSTAYSPSDSFTGTSCGTTRGCCKQNAPVPTATPTLTPTPVSTVTLGLTLNAQDVPTTSDTITPSLTFYSNLAAPTKVTINASGPLQFNKTDVPGKKYSARVALTNLRQDKYFVVARKDNMIAKAAFTVSSANGSVDAPTTTLVFGDINHDNTIDSLDWNIFHDCWKKPATGDCASSDFDGKGGVVDQIDYNTWLRGIQTWNTEVKNL